MPWPRHSLTLDLPARASSPSARAGPRDPRRRRPLRGTSALRSSLIAWFLLTSTAAAQGPPGQAQGDSPRVFEVGELELVYAEPHPDHPDLAELLPVRVELRRGQLGWRAPGEDEPGETLSIGGPQSPVVTLESDGLARVLRALVARIHETGLYGVDVRPASEDIDLVSERDLRPPERTTLRVLVRLGQIEQVRTIAVGDRIEDDWRIDNELHTRIREDSPLQPAGSATDASTNLVNRRALEDYLFRLNRHGGRRVEAALSPSEDPGGVVLDYRVLESKPWFVYGQVSNTGTRRTSRWQTRVGAVHRQLTNRDDVLSLEYLNAGLEDVNGFNMRYQAPFFRRERPDWMNRSDGDPGWIAWLPREKIPWWGVDRMRWELRFAYGRFKVNRASTFSTFANDEVDSEEFQYAGRFIYEAFQHRDLFIDLWGGLRLRDIEVDNESGPAPAGGEELFVLPRFGIHAERVNRVSNFGLDLTVEGSVGNMDQDELENLGRDDVDDDYALLEFNAGYSTFLEPLLRPQAWRDPATELSSTLAHEMALGLRGQYAFDYRLVPQVSQVVGGLYSVRGYDQSIAVGDTVVIGSLEYRFHLPRALPVNRKPLELPYLGDFRATPQQVYGRPDWDLILRAFLDVGRAERNGGSSAGPNERDETLIGTGLGAELQIRSNFRARVDWGVALEETSDKASHSADVGDQEIHVLFSILY
jgi:hypothetical protein